MAADFRPVAPVDPTNLRPMLFLDVAREMMLGRDWSHRAVSVVMESHTGPGRFNFHGANHPDVIEEVHAGRIDVSILNPAAMLTMAHRGTGAFDSPKNVAAVVEGWGGEISYDQPMPNDPSRLGRLEAGELDAIFAMALAYDCRALPAVLR